MADHTDTDCRPSSSHSKPIKPARLCSYCRALCVLACLELVHIGDIRKLIHGLLGGLGDILHGHHHIAGHGTVVIHQWLQLTISAKGLAVVLDGVNAGITELSLTPQLHVHLIGAVSHIAW